MSSDLGSAAAEGVPSVPGDTEASLPSAPAPAEGSEHISEQQQQQQRAREYLAGLSGSANTTMVAQMKELLERKRWQSMTELVLESIQNGALSGICKASITAAAFAAASELFLLICPCCHLNPSTAGCLHPCPLCCT